ncbi:MAG: hypothetical protein IPQ16_06050 [Geobacteraceae bacterium]|nr:hypothetical protein [Geobacteraceae bacterium]
MKTSQISATAVERTRIALLIAAAVQLFFLLAGCGSENTTPAPPTPAALQTMYSSASYDTRTVNPAEISRALIPIISDNRDLIWENGVPGSRVLTLSWIRSSDAKYYDGTVDPACKPLSSNCTLKADLWVTVAPELKIFFFGTMPQSLRIAQLLGVPPEYALEERSMVELWVSPQDMFRPCPDPEITDRECQADFPADPFRSFTSTELVRATEGPGWNIFMNYTGWFNNRKDYIYSNARNYPLSSPYPWTRLGYTYDWGSSNHVGLSEFVVHGRKQNGSGISVGVNSVRTTTEYFTE